jgi:SEC-C motif-containing protein
LHKGQQKAQSAEQLMRSRFSAFYLGAKNINAEQMAAYIEQSCDESLKSEQRAEGLLQSFAQTQWQGLYIIDAKEQAETATVEFTALFNSPDNSLGSSTIEQLHERSSFVKIDQQWLYKSGKMLGPYAFKRNLPCWCENGKLHGKKYKHCHG